MPKILITEPNGTEQKLLVYKETGMFKVLFSKTTIGFSWSEFSNSKE